MHLTSVHAAVLNAYIDKSKDCVKVLSYSCLFTVTTGYHVCEKETTFYHRNQIWGFGEVKQSAISQYIF